MSGYVRLQLGLYGLQQPEAQRAVVALQRDHEVHRPMLRRVGVARERANAVERAGLVRGAFVLLEEAGVRREKGEHFVEAASREAVVAADARAFLKVDG